MNAGVRLAGTLLMPAGANPSAKFLFCWNICRTARTSRAASVVPEISISPEVCNFEQSSK